MQEEGLIVRFKGDAGPLEKAADQAADALLDVDKAANQTNKDLGKLPRISDEVARNAQRLASGAAAAGGALDKTGKISNTATQSLINLGRVAQDAPYGFIGIANNLNPLLEGFQRLRAEAGSNLGALKALGASLTGAGGIGLALSAVTAAASLAQLGFDAWTRGLFSNKDAIDENAMALAELGRQIEDSKDRVEEFASALAYANRIGKLNLEVNLGKGLSTDLTDLQAQSIGNLGLTASLQKEQKRLVEIENEIRARLVPLLSGDQFSAFDKGLLGAFTDDLSDDAKKIYKELENVQQAQDANLKKINASSQQQNIIYRQIALTRNEIADEQAKKAEEAAEKAKKAEEKRLRELKKQLAEAQKLRFEYLNSVRDVNIENAGPDSFFKTLLPPEGAYKANKDFGQVVSRALGTIDIKPRVNIVPEGVSADINGILNAINYEILKENLAFALKNAVQEAIAIGFSGIGDALAAGLSGGDIGDAFKGIFQSIGSVIQELGKQMIALSPLIQAIKTAINTINPALLVPAGIGMIALGGIIKNSFASAKFAQGGVVTGPVLGMVGEGIGTSRANPEIIAPLDKLRQYTNASNEFPEYLPVVNLSGDTLRIWYAKANKRGGLFS